MDLTEGALVPFADYVAEALYGRPTSDSPGGFYTSGAVRFGPSGDFITPPELHSPFYGRGMAGVLARMWASLGRPEPFWIVEVGCGGGRLAQDVLAGLADLHPDLSASCRYVVIDLSGPLLARTRGEVPRAVPIQASALALPLQGVIGCILSSELMDALPFHRLARVDGELVELFVALDGQDLVVRPGPVSTPSLTDLAGDWMHHATDGDELCVSPAAQAALRSFGLTLEAGWVMTIDYGFATAEARRGRSCPPRWFGQRRRLGFHDITCDVDFSSLVRAGRAAGLCSVALAEEVEFTHGFGPYPLGERATDGHGRFVLIQAKKPDGMTEVVQDSLALLQPPPPMAR